MDSEVLLFQPKSIAGTERLQSMSKGGAQPSYFLRLSSQNDDELYSNGKPEKESQNSICLDASVLGDIPARYAISYISHYELPVIGIYVDPKIVPGFYYKVRILTEEKFHIKSYLFGGKGLLLLSIGKGYSKRLTFEADVSTSLNENNNYFWSDSRSEGFGFELQVLTLSQKFIIHEPSHPIIGTVEIIKIQGHQKEISHKMSQDRSIEKRATVQAICKVELFGYSKNPVLQPMSGVAVTVKKNGWDKAVLVRIISVTLGGCPEKNGYTLIPGNTRTPLRKGKEGKDICSAKVNSISQLKPSLSSELGYYLDNGILSISRRKYHFHEFNKYTRTSVSPRLLPIKFGNSEDLTLESKSNKAIKLQLNLTPDIFSWVLQEIALNDFEFIQWNKETLTPAVVLKIDNFRNKLRKKIEKRKSTTEIIAKSPNPSFRSHPRRLLEKYDEDRYKALNFNFELKNQ